MSGLTGTGAAAQSPVLAKVNYDNGNLTVNWLPISGSTYFLTSVFLGNNPVTGASSINQGFGAVFSPNPALQTNQNYQVMVAQCDSGGNQTSPYSQPFYLIQNPVTGPNAFYGADNSLRVAWTPPAYGDPTGAEVVLLQTGVSDPLLSTLATGNTITLQPDVPLQGTNSYTINVIPANNNGGSTGPNTSLPLYLQPATVDDVSYSADLNKVVAHATPPSQPPANMQLYISLYVNGVLSGSNTDNSTISASIALPASGLNYADLYTVTLRNAVNGAFGPETVPVTVVIAPPVLQSVAFTGPNVAVAWRNLPARYPLTGGEIGLIGDGNGINSNEVQGDSGTVDVPASPVYTKYQVQVNAAFGDSTGPRCAPVTVPSRTPGINAVSYDGNTVTVSWNPVDNAPGYQCQVTDSYGHVVAAANTSGTTASVGLRLDPTVVYQATVQAYGVIGGITISGPVGTAGNIITACPVIASANYNNGSLVVSWNAGDLSKITGITGYQAGVYLCGQLQGSLVDIPGATTGTKTIPVNLSAWQKFTVAVRATGTLGKGPFSAAAYIISDSPAPAAVTYDGNTIEMSWTAGGASAATGYLVTLYKDGTAQPVTDANYSGSNSWSLTTPLTAGSKWTAAVQAVSCVAQGPYSGALTIINDVVQLLSATYDGRVLKATRGTSASTYITGYSWQLLEGNEVLQTINTMATSVAMVVALSSDAVYTMRVQPTGDRTSGQYSGSVTLLSVAPQLSSIAYDGTTLTVGWSAITGSTGYTLQVFQGDEPVAISPTYKGAGATATIALSAWKDYRVQVYATVGAVSGPPSVSEPVVAFTPAPAQLQYDGASASVRWSPVEGAGDIVWLVTLYKDGAAQPVTDANYTRGSELALAGALATGHAWTASVQAVGGIATGPASAQLPLIVDSVQTGVISYDRSVLTVSWSALSDTHVAGYWLSLLQGGTVLASIYTTGTKASLNYTLDNANSYTCLVKAAGVVSGVPTIGPGSSSATLLSQAPTLTSVVYQSGALTVKWNTLSGISDYRLALYNEDINIPIQPTYSSGSATVTLALDAVKRYSVTVNTVSGSVSGPLSLAADVISAPPLVGQFSYDGVALQVEWAAVEQPAVTGYQVVVSDSSGNKNTVNVAFNRASIPVVFSDALTYTLTVCAIGDKATGPFSTAVNPYVIEPAYYFAAYAQNVQPWISRSGVRPPQPAAFSLYLPQLFNTPPATLPPGLAPGGTSPFQMSATNNAALPYMLAIAVNSDAWLFNDEAIRSSLQTDYLNFVTALENVTGGLLPGTVPFLQQLVARSFPLTFDETIYYATGYNPEGKYVNLQAGMRVSLSFGEYQFTGPAGAGNPTALLNGFVGSGGSSYVMGSYLSGATQNQQVLDLGFSNFLSAIVQDVEANSGGGANILDLYNSAFRQPYFRIVYPSVFPSADGPGWSDNTKNIAVLGAVNYQTLEAATTAVLNGAPVPSGASLTFFRGRVSIIPEIQVFVNGKQQWVAIGTTVRNLLEELYGSVPRSVVNTTGRKVMNVQLMRLADNIVTDLSNVSALTMIGQRNGVAFSYQAITTYSNGMDDFDLPLLQGDAVVIETTGT